MFVEYFHLAATTKVCSQRDTEMMHVASWMPSQHCRHSKYSSREYNELHINWVQMDFRLKLQRGSAASILAHTKLEASTHSFVGCLNNDWSNGFVRSVVEQLLKLVPKLRIYNIYTLIVAVHIIIIIICTRMQSTSFSLWLNIWIDLVDAHSRVFSFIIPSWQMQQHVCVCAHRHILHYSLHSQMVEKNTWDVMNTITWNAFSILMGIAFGLYKQ